MNKLHKSAGANKLNVLHETNKPIYDSTFETIFNQSPISTQIFLPDGTLIAVNKAWENLWGVTLEKIRGYNIFKDKQLINTKIMPLVKKGFKGEEIVFPPVRYEPNKTISGISEVTYRWTQSRMYSVKNSKGKVIKVILQHNDISGHHLKKPRLVSPIHQ
jgi:PAS domain S-box-containing protein